MEASFSIQYEAFSVEEEGGECYKAALSKVNTRITYFLPDLNIKDFSEAPVT